MFALGMKVRFIRPADRRFTGVEGEIVYIRPDTDNPFLVDIHERRCGTVWATHNGGWGYQHPTHTCLWEAERNLHILPDQDLPAINEAAHD